MVLTAALLCLAINTYHEARGESFKGQVAVADVVMNRVSKGNKSVCGIVTEYRQFSWLNDSFRPIWKWDHGRKVVIAQKLDPKWIKQYMPEDGPEWRSAIQASRLALYQEIPDVTHGSTYYHAQRVSPAWKKEKVRMVQIGKHIFYTDRKPAVYAKEGKYLDSI